MKSRHGRPPFIANRTSMTGDIQQCMGRQSDQTYEGQEVITWQISIGIQSGKGTGVWEETLNGV